MNTKVKTHKRKGKNKVSVVREHTRIDKKGKKSLKNCNMAECSAADLRDLANQNECQYTKRRAIKELSKRGLNE